MAIPTLTVRDDLVHHVTPFGEFVEDPYANDLIVLPLSEKSLVHVHGGNDTVIGNDGKDYIFDDPGLDPLHRGSGDDTIHAGRGDDTIFAGDGHNLYDGGDGIDTVDYSRASHGVKVDLGQGAGIGDGIDTLQSIETVIGSKFDDVLVGSAGPDTLIGGDGNDILRGGAEGNDTLVGGAGDDKLFGGFGQDILIGGDGKDLLRGGGGADILTGGTGADTFYFDLTLYHADWQHPYDTITDFHEGEDKIQVAPSASHPLTFDNVSTSYDSTTDKTTVHVSDTTSHLIVYLSGQHDLHAGDFVFT